MDVDTARKIDYYVGVPMCFVGTILKKIGAGLVRRRRGKPPTNVLFIECSEMGSAILAYPAIRKVEKALNVPLYFAIFAKNRPALDLLGAIPRENIFVISDASLWSVALGAVRLLAWARAKKIDTVVDFELFSRFTALLSGFSGAARIVGFHPFFEKGLYRGGFLTHRVAYNPHQHIAKNYLALANALISQKPEVPYSKSIIADEELVLPARVAGDLEQDTTMRNIREEFSGYDPQAHVVVLFNTDSSGLVPLRRWPREYYVELAKLVLDRYRQVLILLTGDPSERAGKELLRKAVASERCINFAGRTAIADLPALYAQSALLLTNDSGPAHLASLTEIPVFVFFGPETPRCYAPLGHPTIFYANFACSPCVSAANQRRSPCDDNACLKAISPEVVFRGLQPILEAHGCPVE